MKMFKKELKGIIFCSFLDWQTHHFRKKERGIQFGKLNINTIPYQHDTHTQLADMYKVGIISEAHGTIPLIIPLVIPLCLESPSPVPEPLLLTWNPSFACGDSRPLWSQVTCVLTSPLPLPSPSSFPAPQWFPISNMCPPTTTLRHRLHIVRYSIYIVLIPE